MASRDGDGDRGESSPLPSPGNESESGSSYVGSASSDAGHSPYIDDDQEESVPSNQHLVAEPVPVPVPTANVRPSRPDTPIPSPVGSRNHPLALDDSDHERVGAPVSRAEQLSRRASGTTMVEALHDSAARPRASTSSRPASSQSSLRGEAPVFRPSQASHPTPVQPQLEQQQAAMTVPRRRAPADINLPHWQPDAEVMHCPICRTQFTMFVRKHHCRKCGRVVCASCSPHRITIPYQYIVRPPGDTTLLRSSGFWGEESGIADFSSLGGGERVRLCNPCVPDPNITPPANVSQFSLRSLHQRSRSGAAGPSSGYASFGGLGQTEDVNHRMRSATVSSNFSRQSHHGQSYLASQYPGYHQWVPPQSSFASSSRHPQAHYISGRYEEFASAGPSSSSAIHNRPLPPSPQIAEEDECPVCHDELPSRTLPNFESLREDHINGCVTAHSTYSAPPTPGQPGTHGTPPPRAVRRTGMFPYAATEKDCVDSAECSICFEEYRVGDPMARLECLCRFHRPCILLWFKSHPGRCPVHQHDSYGY